MRHLLRPSSAPSWRLRKPPGTLSKRWPVTASSLPSCTPDFSASIVTGSPTPREVLVSSLHPTSSQARRRGPTWATLCSVRLLSSACREATSEGGQGQGRPLGKEREVKERGFGGGGGVVQWLASLALHLYYAPAHSLKAKTPSMGAWRARA